MAAQHQRELAMPRIIPALVRSFIAQVIACAALLCVIDFLIPVGSSEYSPTLIPLLIALLISSSTAFIIARLVGLSRSWALCNGAIPPAVIIAFLFSIPSWAFFILALLIFALYLPAFFSQVPFFPTSTAIIEKLLEILPTDKKFIFIDLGCGFGEPLFSLARTRKNGSFIGIDLSPLSLLVAWARSLFYPNVRIRVANLWQHPLSEYDYVYAFLAPPPMERIGEKASREMKKGAILISNTFKVPNLRGKEILVDDPRQSSLFLYTAHTET